MDWRVLRRYSGDQLNEISLPVGGIGTGFFSLEGTGHFADWQVTNRPSRGWRPTFSHLLLRTDSGGNVQLRVLERDLERGAAADFGNPEPLAGIPRFPKCEFESTYPFGRVKLADPDMPVDVEIEAFNPLVPKDADASGIPCGLLSVTLRNKSARPLEARLTFLLNNFIGADGVDRDQKMNVTDYAATNGWSGFAMRKESDAKLLTVGTLAALWNQPDAKTARRVKIVDTAWRHDVLSIIDQLLGQGYLADVDPSAPCPPSEEGGWLSATTSKLSIPGGGEQTARLLIAWHFPWQVPHKEGWDIGADPNYTIKNYYATLHENSLDVAKKTIARLDDLRDKTTAFVNGIMDGPAPDVMKEAALFNLGGLRSHTSFRLEDGTFFAFEGCGGQYGCCAGSCSHVWNYEEATISLFPDLHRTMLETHLGENVTPQGGDRFRVALPIKNSDYNGAAADGQMGVVVRAYLQYRTDQDKDWLLKHYPKIKSLIEFAWIPGGWDYDQDGVMEGAQHNTYDVQFYGPNPLCTGWYLAALAAASQLAKVVGDEPFSAKCDELRQKGSAWVDKNLFNGSYYFQIPRTPAQKPDPMTMADGGESSADRYQVGKGCLVDQLCGQYKANRAGLGDLLDRYHIKEAVKSIFERNFFPNLRDHYNNMRSFAYGDEAGTVICSYAPGERPAIPFPYWSECMTGFEYQLAVLLLDYGYKKEATQVVKAIRDRHDGRRRNPFNEPECGSFYARAMASWALLDAWKA